MFCDIIIFISLKKKIVTSFFSKKKFCLSKKEVSEKKFRGKKK